MWAAPFAPFAREDDVAGYGGVLLSAFSVGDIIKYRLYAWGGSTMQVISLTIGLMLFISVPSFAQGWFEYQSRKDFFGVSFPGEPNVKDTTWSQSDEGTAKPFGYPCGWLRWGGPSLPIRHRCQPGLGEVTPGAYWSSSGR